MNAAAAIAPVAMNSRRDEPVGEAEAAGVLGVLVSDINR